MLHAQKPTVQELLYLAIEVSAAEAAFDTFAQTLRGGVGRDIKDIPDSLDAAAEREGGPSSRVRAFFKNLKTPDLLLLVTLYYAARNWKNDFDNEGELDPAQAIRNELKSTRRGSEQETRKAALLKLLEVAGANRVFEFTEALARFARAADAMRKDFDTF